MRLFILSIICGAIFLSGCASSQISSTPVKGVSNEMFEGTWESYPTGKLKVVVKFTFLPDGHCHLVLDNINKKSAYDHFGTYVVIDNSATAKFIENPRKPHHHYTISIDQITPIDQGKYLDLRLINTIYWDKDGKEISHKLWGTYGTKIPTNKTPDYGRYQLHRVTSLKDIFSNLISKL
jgi:hypothetical protein